MQPETELYHTVNDPAENMDIVKPKKQKETKATLDTKVQANDTGWWFIIMWRQVNILHLRLGVPHSVSYHF